MVMKRRWECMNKDEIIRRNLDILNEFMKYAFEFPDTLDKIPEDAELVILPQNDPEMFRENTKLIDKLKGGEKLCRCANEEARNDSSA